MTYATAPTPTRQPGTVRSVGMTMLLFFVTCGIWGLYWAYKVGEELQRYTGRGLGGLVHLLIWWIVSPVSGFLIPKEIEEMYQAEGEQSPVTVMDGLWLFPGIFIIVGPFIWYIKVQNALNDFWSRRGGQPGY
jgi:hypothetical protein